MEQEGFDFNQLIHWVNTPFFHIGQTPVTLGGIGSAFFVFFICLFISGLVQKALSKQLSNRFQISSGASYALLRILHYVIVILGVILAAQCIGLNFGSLAVIFGFLSVGIGFGLQNIASNFISGLILLLERPISVGDYVTVDDQIGQVAHINMRATVVHTLDNISIIVPNSKLIEGHVMNCSHDNDTLIRLHCPVGVAYGSDIPLVKQTLLDVAKQFPNVVETKPAPEVRFLEFGDSSLNFELLVWTHHPIQQDLTKSDINYAIDEAFRKAGIQIPFPQRDVHLQLTPAIEELSKSN